MIVARLKSRHVSFIDILFVLLMAGLLYYGASWQYFSIYDDVARYQCYTQVFWHGFDSINALGADHCNFLRHPERSVIPVTHEELVSALQKFGLPEGIVRFVDGQSPYQPFHALPYEYPMLTLIPFTLAKVVVPAVFFQMSFAVLMVLLSAVIYFALLHWKSRWSALAYAILIVMGGWGTVAGRFDLIPAAFTLFAVICGDRKRWNWAFAFLALAVLYKYYPIVLLIPFLFVQLRDSPFSWKSWRRWQPLGVFILLSVVVMGVSLSLSVQGTISPFLYLGNRPVQVESLAGSLLWISSKLFTHSAQYAYTFGSLNILASGASIISALMTLAEVASVLYIFWLLWRRKVNLAVCCLLVLLLIIITGKVFSPQYLIWVIPLVAYTGEGKRSWLLLWSLIGLLTMIIYPVIYTHISGITNVPLSRLFFPLVTLRDFLLMGFTIYLIYKAARRTLVKASSAETSNVSVGASSIECLES